MSNQPLWRRVVLAGGVMAVALTTAACPSNIRQTYKGFESAVDKGAECSDLIDMRNRLKKDDDRTRADAALTRIGCESPNSARTDR